MASDYLGAFAHVFTVAAKENNLPIRKTRLRDFLDDEKNKNESCPYTLAALAIHHFCVDDSKFNGFTIGLAAALRTLERVTESKFPAQSELQNLKTILKDPTHFAILAWIKKSFKPPN